MKKNIIPTRISPTAHATSYAWDLLDIPYSKYFTDPNYKLFFKILRFFAFPYFANKKNDYIYFMLEPRHRAIDYFITSKFPYNQIIEFACGLSPRGMKFAEDKEITYIESDLPKMLEMKKQKVEEIYQKKNIKRPNHQFIATDLLTDNVSEVVSPLINKNEKLIVITEGLTPYFDMEHLKKIFINIYRILKDNGGGVYITDIYHEEDMARNILNNKIMSTAVKLIKADFHLDIDNGDEGEAFFKECGFDFVEMINPLHFSKQLALKGNVPPENGVATIYIAHVF
jgi:O-methyltransferase involved in polyketide biosynthesis